MTTESIETPSDSRNPLGTAAFGIVLVLLGGAILYFSQGIRAFALGNHDPGPKAIPLGCGVILILGGLAQLAQAFVYEGFMQSRSNWKIALNLRLWLIFVALVLYVCLLDSLGFLAATCFFLLGALKLFGSKWVESIVSTVLLVAFIYFLFEIVFKVSLPQGNFF